MMLAASRQCFAENKEPGTAILPPVVVIGTNLLEPYRCESPLRFLFRNLALSFRVGKAAHPAEVIKTTQTASAGSDFKQKLIRKTKANQTYYEDYLPAQAKRGVHPP
jgi:hypothetical protein